MESAKLTRDRTVKRIEQAKGVGSDSIDKVVTTMRKIGRRKQGSARQPRR